MELCYLISSPPPFRFVHISKIHYKSRRKKPDSILENLNERAIFFQGGGELPQFSKDGNDPLSLPPPLSRHGLLKSTTNCEGSNISKLC